MTQKGRSPRLPFFLPSAQSTARLRPLSFPRFWRACQHATTPAPQRRFATTSARVRGGVRGGRAPSSPLHGGRLSGVGVAEVVAVGAVAAAVLVGGYVELAHLGAAHGGGGGSALLSLAAGLAAPAEVGGDVSAAASASARHVGSARPRLGGPRPPPSGKVPGGRAGLGARGQTKVSPTGRRGRAAASARPAPRRRGQGTHSCARDLGEVPRTATLHSPPSPPHLPLPFTTAETDATPLGDCHIGY